MMLCYRQAGPSHQQCRRRSLPELPQEPCIKLARSQYPVLETLSEQKCLHECVSAQAMRVQVTRRAHRCAGMIHDEAG